MAEVSANFDLGTPAATIATTDTGNATAWDVVNIGSENTITYDATHFVNGSQGAKFLTGGSSPTVRLEWTTALGGSLTDYYWRCYLYITAFPASIVELLQHRAAGDQRWSIRISSAGAITLLDQAGGTIATFSTTLQTGAWTRFEGHTVHSSGDLEVKLFHDAGSTTPTETQSVNGQSLGANSNVASFGWGALNGPAAWLDALVDGATSYPGPVPLTNSGVIVLPLGFNAFSFGKSGQQLAFPASDSADGAWTDQAGGASLFAAINASGYPESDYIRSEVSPQTSGCRVKLATLEQPPVVDTGHVIRWRASKDLIAGDQINMTVTLRQGGGTTLGGGTQIATFVRNNVTDSFTTFAETLSEAEAATITNYNDLYLEFYADVP